MMQKQIFGGKEQQHVAPDDLPILVHRPYAVGVPVVPDAYLVTSSGNRIL